MCDIRASSYGARRRAFLSSSVDYSEISARVAPRRKRTFPQLGHSAGPREHILAVGLSHLSFPALCPRAEQLANCIRGFESERVRR